MTLPYSDPRELMEKYCGTIIYNGKVPVMVDTITDDGSLAVVEIGSKRAAYMVPADDPALRDQPFCIGYLNKVRQGNWFGVTYMTRVPKRQWRQGLCGDTIVSRPYNVILADACISDQFREMLMNQYPSFKKARTLLVGALKSAAFNQKLALEITEFDQLKLNYRGKSVGISDDGDKFKLKKDSWYLKEFMEVNGVELW